MSPPEKKNKKNKKKPTSPPPPPPQTPPQTPPSPQPQPASPPKISKPKSPNILRRPFREGVPYIAYNPRYGLRTNGKVIVPFIEPKMTREERKKYVEQVRKLEREGEVFGELMDEAGKEEKKEKKEKEKRRQ